MQLTAHQLTSSYQQVDQLAGPWTEFRNYRQRKTRGGGASCDSLPAGLYSKRIDLSSRIDPGLRRGPVLAQVAQAWLASVPCRWRPHNSSESLRAPGSVRSAGKWFRIKLLWYISSHNIISSPNPPDADLFKCQSITWNQFLVSKYSMLPLVQSYSRSEHMCVTRSSCGCNAGA
jgi:hypothetical protein